MDQPIGIRLPREILKKIEEIGKQQMEDRSTIIRKLVIAGYLQLTKEKAAQAYIQGKITITEAAKRANLTVWEFEKYLIEQGFKSEYSIYDLDKELRLLERIK